MSDSSAHPSKDSARPVSWMAVVAVFGGFALFLLLSYSIYLPRRSAGPGNAPAENAPEDQVWKAMPEGRKAYLVELREKEAKQATSYAWIDQSKGIVQLPLQRAMELTVQDIDARAAK